MIRFIISHLWIAIFAILFGLGEYAFWYDAIYKYKKRGDSEDLVGLIIFHALVIGFGSFIYWIISLPVAE